MPTYDYRCADCSLEVEVTHGIHASGPSTCTACGGTMRKALSTPAIHFKGSGWAKKDARAAAKPAPSSGSTTSTEKKPATGDGEAKAPSESRSTGTESEAPAASPERPAPAKPSSGGSE
jgi:putative FmdB family regulatory protein